MASEVQADVMLYDPPGGWRYGFPKAYLPRPGESLADTLVRDGYPPQEIENGGARHCRFIGDGAIDVASKVGSVVVPEQEHPQASNDNAPVRERIGDWIATFTGKSVYPMDLRSNEVDINDIAHSLAMQCRFNGHCLNFYSVAEHSVLIARWLVDHQGTHVALAGLLHDATEAYLTDVPRPVKPFLQGYKEAEARAWLAIAERFGLASDLPAEVHEADNRILFDEKAQNMGPCERDWAFSLEPLDVTLQFWTPEQAEAEFLKTYWNLIETGRH